MDKKRIVEKMMEYLDSKLLMDDNEEIKEGLLAIMESEDEALIFDESDIPLLYTNQIAIEYALKKYMSEGINKKNVTTCLKGYDIFANLNEYLEDVDAQDTHLNFFLNAELNGNFPIVINFPSDLIHQRIDIETNREIETPTWRRALRDMTKEEVTFGETYFVDYFLEEFEDFLEGVHPDISLELLKTCQDDEELTEFFPNGELLVLYLSTAFDYNTLTGEQAGETIRILIPSTSFHKMIH